MSTCNRVFLMVISSDYLNESMLFIYAANVVHEGIFIILYL